MSSFNPQFLAGLTFGHDVTHVLRLIGRGQGKQDLHSQRAPEVLASLRRQSLIESTESSNRLEGITVSHAAMSRLMHGNELPDANAREEGEIAGYRDVLGTIHEYGQGMRPSANLLLQMHRDMLRYTASAGGRWKNVDNTITETRPDGTVFVRFKPTAAWQTAQAIADLHNRFDEEMDRAQVEPLILIALYVLDFLCIHPFSDGNGRMARLLTVLQLYRHEYTVVRWVSIERIYERTKESYYDTLYRSSLGWHQGQHDPHPWIAYFLSVLQAAYQDFESRLEHLQGGHGFKKQLVLEALNRTRGTFSIGEIEQTAQSVGRDHIRNVMQEQRRLGLLVCEGKGRYARWRKA
jgi:Fic family protein